MNKGSFLWLSAWLSSSLRRALVVGAALAILLPALLVGYFQIVRPFKIEVERKTRAPALRYAEMLTRGLALEIWNLDKESISEQVDAVMRDPDVMSVTITDEVNEIVLHRQRPTPSQAPPLKEERDVFYHGEYFGHVVVMLSPDRIVRERMSEVLALSLALAAQVAFSLLFIWLLFERRLVQPLTHLQQGAQRLARGELELPLQQYRPDEIGLLAQSMDQMRLDWAALIAERTEHLRALELSEQRQSLALFGGDLGLWDWDVPTDHLLVDARWCAMIGHTLAEVVPHNRGWSSWLHPDDAPAVLSALDAHLKNETPHYEAEFRMQHAAGHWVWILGRGRVVERDSSGFALRMTGTHLDITVRKRVEAALQENEERWKFALEGSGEGVWDWNYQTGETLFSRRWKELLGFEESEIGNNFSEWSSRMHPDDWPKVKAAIQDHVEGKAVFAAVEYRMSCKDGRWLWMLARGMVVGRDADGKPLRLVGTNADISERRAAADKIENLAFYDTLTGLPNRRLLLDRLEQSLSSSARHQRHGALMLLDMDDFKTLNDTLGHDVGDQFLIEVARRLEASVREGDTVARLGGDEFVVILEELKEDSLAAMQAETVAMKILQAVSEPYHLDLSAGSGLKSSRSYHCTSSVGISLFHGKAVSADELLKRADTAMYQAKAAGGNAFCFFDPGMQAEVTARAALDNDLREALREAQFRLHYQPQVDQAGRWTGAEALVRWQHPQRGMVSPLEFIPQAELSGLILPLGDWVLEAACAQLMSWEGTPELSRLTLAVNVSARQFRQKDFVNRVLEIVERTGADSKKLKLELTESLLLDNVEDIIAKMTALKAHGIGFSLDDFGTGYSSLSYLKRLPLDQLKIDRSFVRDVLIDHNDAAIARTIVALARSMGLKVIAEGVETEEQRKFLAANGCTAYQGYLFGRPMPADDFLRRFFEVSKVQ